MPLATQNVLSHLEIDGITNHSITLDVVAKNPVPSYADKSIVSPAERTIVTQSSKRGNAKTPLKAKGVIKQPIVRSVDGVDTVVAYNYATVDAKVQEISTEAERHELMQLASGVAAGGDLYLAVKSNEDIY
jgi:hypothetical protein